MSQLSIPNTVANGNAADGNQVGANFAAIQAWADSHVVEDTSVALMPTGAVLPYAGSAAPSGYLLADGTAVSRVTYAALWTLIGTTYGAGDGSTTFNLPNLKARFPVGRDASVASHDALGETGGSRDAINVAHSHTASSGNVSNDHTHAFSTSSDGAHTHTYTSRESSQALVNAGASYQIGTAVASATATSSDGSHSHSGTTGGISANHTHGITVDSAGSSGTNANLPPYLTLNYIIKT